MSALLEVASLEAGYGDIEVLRGVDLEIHAGEVVTLVGPNGAGKTTLMHAIAGLIPASGGAVRFDGEPLVGRPAHQIAADGFVLVPEGRRLFPFLTVAENLALGAYSKRARPRREETLREVYELFPTLEQRSEQLAGSLSGGEQQMCALGRGLMSRPKLIALDEPSLGLAPIVVERLFELIGTLAESGLTVLLIEQNVVEALELAERGYVLEQGRVTLSGSAQELLGNERVQAAYLGLEEDR